MKSFSTKLIPALGIPIAMGILAAAQGVPLNTTTMASPVGPPQLIDPANTTFITSTVGNLPQVTAQPTQSIPSTDNYTVTLINSHTAAVVTLHAQGENSPTAIRQENDAHTIGRSETATFAIPTRWTGRVAMFEDGYSDIQNRATLLEGSFMNATTFGPAVIALDVSYVDAFTVPVVCECNNTIVFGCNLDLHNMCPPNATMNAKTCANPNRDFKVGVPPTNPFQDCQGMAYTFPQDDLATKYNISGCSRQITCCIGTACRPHPGQLLCPMGDGLTQACATH
ncbi:hypothetical protein F4776DRAFT_571493 [Hypoxylon sp. NC0597]|nr:hypothetical protein F4776DRAFT_571493 [Hypoxylon sp. NC0597]